MATVSACSLYGISVAMSILLAASTSSKMDFLALGHVRTDPIVNPKCLSDHVHTFYGANVSLQPSTTYSDLRAAKGSSGNVKENLSLYWHPTIYKFVNGVYTLVETWFTTAYYIWDTGKAKAFPDGFQMIASMSHGNRSRWHFICDGKSNKNFSHPNPTSSWNFPTTTCNELEMRIVFPTCWDGRTTSPDHMSHVAYDIEEASYGSHNGKCPSSHNYGRLPEIQLYLRIKDYSGEHHVFSNGGDQLHADYFSGWNQAELQKVLDTCSNSGEAAMPDMWCENQLTFKDAPKKFDPNINNDPGIFSKLKKLQPNLPDTKKVTLENVTGITALPRGCDGCMYQGKCYTSHPEVGQTLTEQSCNQYAGTQWCGKSTSQSLLDSSTSGRFRKQRKAKWPITPEEDEAWTAAGMDAHSSFHAGPKSTGWFLMQTGADVVKEDTVEVALVTALGHEEGSQTDPEVASVEL